MVHPLAPPNFDSIELINQVVAERQNGVNAAYFAERAEEWAERVQGYIDGVARPRKFPSGQRSTTARLRLSASIPIRRKTRHRIATTSRKADYSSALVVSCHSRILMHNRPTTMWYNRGSDAPSGVNDGCSCTSMVHVPRYSPSLVTTEPSSQRLIG